MAKRSKKIVKGAESLKKQIEEHLARIEQDVREKRIERGLYHVKEVDKSLLKALELKSDILGKKDSSVEDYREKLKKLKEKLESK